MKYRDFAGQRWALFFVFVCFALGVGRSKQPAVFAALQQAGCINPPTGVVASYRGEGTASDASGSNGGSVLGGVGYSPGRFGRAFLFDGTGEVIVPDNTSLNPKHISMEAWVYPTLLDGNFDIIAAKETEPSGTFHYEIAIKGPKGPSPKIPVGNLAFAINGVIGLPDDYLSWVNGGGQVPLNKWTHVGLTFDGVTATTYINGKMARQITNLRGKMPETNGALRLGARSPAVISRSPEDRFNGLIDEFGLYNRALTASEMETLATSNAPKCFNVAPKVTLSAVGGSLTRQQGSLSSVTVPLATVSDEETPAGNLKVQLNAPLGLSLSDVTNTNGVITAKVAANCNAAIGANQVELVVSDDKQSTKATLTVTVTANNAPGLGTYANTTVAIDKGATITPSVPPSDNGKIMSMTVEGAPGVAINETTGVVTLPATTPLGTYPIRVKATDNCGTTTTRNFAVSVILTCVEIPPGQLAWFRGENNANGGGTTGTLLGGIGFAPGKVGQAFSFDGLDDAVSFGNTLGNFGKSDFSIGFWMRTKSTRREILIGKRGQCGHSSFWSIRLIEGQLFIELDQAAGPTYNLLKSIKSVNDDKFHHVMITRQAATLALYLDGVLEKSQLRAAQADVVNTANLFMGRDPCIGVDGTQPFTGLLDEFEIFNRALTAAEVFRIFRADRLGRCITPPATDGGRETLALDVADSLPVVGQLLIRQVRFAGPEGANDWYVELFNNSDWTVTTKGLVLGLADATGQQIMTLDLSPQRMIAPRGSYLIAGSAYSLGVTAAQMRGVMPDQQAGALSFARLGGVGLFAGKLASAQRLDAVRSLPIANGYFAEGEPLPDLYGQAFARRVGNQGELLDTQNNALDFISVSLPQLRNSTMKQP